MSPIKPHDESYRPRALPQVEEVAPTEAAPLELGPLTVAPDPGTGGITRILRETVATLSETFAVDGAPTDPSPDTATIEIVADDGTVLVPADTATTRTGVGTFAFTLSSDQTALLDHLTIRWTSSLGVLTTTAEIVGGFLFTIAEAQAAGLTGSITAVRTRVEQAIEDACGCAFVPRYDRETLNGDGTTLLRLGRPFLRRIRWASTLVGGVTTTLLPADLSLLSLSSAGFVSGYTWPVGFGSVMVGYEHGMDRPPEPVRAAALDYARFLLTQDSGIDSRVTQLQTDDGTLVFGGGQTGLPGVDRVIDQYRMVTIA